MCSLLELLSCVFGAPELRSERVDWVGQTGIAGDTVSDSLSAAESKTADRQDIDLQGEHSLPLPDSEPKQSPLISWNH